MKKNLKSVVIISGPDVCHYGSSHGNPDKGKVWKWFKGILTGTVVALAETTVHATFSAWLYGLLIGFVSAGCASWLTLLIPIVCVALITGIICGF